MDATDLDEDFVNFESVSQTCSSSTLDDELSLLDNEARQRERKSQQEQRQQLERDKEGDDLGEELVEEDERNNNDPRPMKMKNDEGESAPTGKEHLFAPSFTYTSKRLTMIPVKYKMKEERRKVLKISINKLKKIDDPESWLCRSVLINNTMKKLQKEARDEKMQKQMNAYTKNYLVKSGMDADDYCQLNNNNRMSGELCPMKMDDQDCFYQKEFIQKEKEDVFCQLSNGKAEEFEFRDRGKERVEAGREEERATPEESSISNGVPLNEDFVEKIPSIKRCASRKRSLDEDGTASEILNLDEADLEVESSKRPRPESDEMDECDVHDVLSQLYMPPTPRMLTSIDSDTDEDDLNVVDIDSSYIDGIKPECQSGKEEGLFGKRKSAEQSEEPSPGKRNKLTDDLFSCFNVCETGFLGTEFAGNKRDNFDNFLCNNKGKDKDRTSVESENSRSGKEEEEFIELEDEEDIKRRLSQSLSSHYHHQQQQLQPQQQQQPKIEKNCDFFDETATGSGTPSATCDNNQYSCGHIVNMFNDIQSVTFHNLIASLET